MNTTEKAPIEQFAEFYGLTPEMVQQIMEACQDLSYFNLQNEMSEEEREQAEYDAAVERLGEAVRNSGAAQVFFSIADFLNDVVIGLSVMLRK